MLRSKSDILPVSMDGIPAELRALPQWVLWKAEPREGKEGLSKPPYQVSGASYASTTIPETWAAFDDVWAAYQAGRADGVGLVLAKGDGLCGVDLDACFNEAGELSPEAAAIVRTFGSYTEQSVSGTGLHIIARIKKSLPKCAKTETVEIYDKSRFLTVTGRVWNDLREIKDCTGEALSLVSRLSESRAKPERRDTEGGEDGKGRQDPPLSDDELIRKAMSAKNGLKFRRLWSGDTTEYENDHSRADEALLRMLAFWTNCDAERMERLFSKSGLAERTKWTERADYQLRSIRRAIEYQRTQGGAAADFEVLPTDDDDFFTDGGRSGRKNTIQKLLQLCEVLSVEVFLDKDMGTWFCRFPSNGRKVIDLLLSERFEDWLRLMFFNATGESLTSTGFGAVCGLLRGRMRESDSAKAQRVFLRVGEAGGKFYLDLANAAGQVVEIDAAGWRVLDDCPLWWWRPSSMEALPVPVAGGTLSLFRPFVNADEADFQLICGWLLAALNPCVEYPILAISSEAGSGKSTLTEFLKRLIDPDAAGACAPFKNGDAVKAAARSRHVLALDNVSKITPDDADRFCRLATGAGETDRKLYTDAESFDIRLRRPLVLNGITFTPDRADLLTRCFPVQLKPLNENRRGGVELRRDFEAARPRILGALLDGVSSALRMEAEGYNPHYTGRMADCVGFVMRAARGLDSRSPFSAEAFQNALQTKTREIMGDTVVDSPVGNYVFNLAQDYGGCLVTKLTTDILKAVRMMSDSSWDRAALPKTPKATGWVLTGLIPALRAAGVEVTKKHTRKGAEWTFQYLGGN
ncbi:MAG: hypothetical protein IJU98_10535 [Synergistaceae bacterium]|nr:hypothetical protein [Synergistaceae bacterium]